MSVLTAVSAFGNSLTLTPALLLISVSLLIYCSKHWVLVSRRDRDNAKRRKFAGLLSWRKEDDEEQMATSQVRKRRDDAFENFLRS